jgi:ElaB/YqjD/DUF883 family membrane-anchored ribosome-binding protein
MSPRNPKAKEQEKAAEQAGDEAAQEVKDRTGTGEKPPSDPEELRQEIRETREEVGETVEALAQKADVKSQAQQKIDERKEQLRERQEQAKAKAAEIREKVTSVTPEQAREASGQMAQQVQERPLPFAVGAAFAGGLLVGFLLRRR